MTRSRRRSSVLPVFLALFVLACLLVAVSASLLIPLFAQRTFGPPSVALGALQRLQYSALVLWNSDALTQPVNPAAGEQVFTVSTGESAETVAGRLEQAGLVRDADAFRAYLVYSGLDTGIQAGEFRLSPAQTPLQIALKLQDATPTQVKFGILPGWRLEEVAESLPTSGLDITPDQFLQLARNPQANLDFLPASASAEGFLLPGEYTVPRVIQPRQLLEMLLNQTALALTPEIRAGFARQGLDVYQAVTLASIIQREAVLPDEQPIIASVFFNRLAAGMLLQTDPTVQYALGFDPASNSWWKIALTRADLEINSPYNTYLNVGLPPGPISNPALSAIQAVAYPAQTPYYYFRARCDGSRTHFFAETYDQHLQNACP
jgi:UPF0755 protein